jgi:hypothetical protein
MKNRDLELHVSPTGGYKTWSRRIEVIHTSLDATAHDHTCRHCRLDRRDRFAKFPTIPIQVAWKLFLE